MIIINTTFYVHLSLEDAFLKWAREEYFPDAIRDGLNDCVFSRLLIDIQDNAVGYALAVTAPDEASAVAWHDGKGTELRKRFADGKGEKVLHFTTYMEKLSL